MRIALLGAFGQLGKHLTRILKLSSEYNLWATDLQDFDLSNTDLIYSTVQAQNPDLIINTAAYTDVDGAETNQEIAYRLNYNAPRELAKLAYALNVPLIHFSTDYVFDGTKEKPYTEDDTPNPLSCYGLTKLHADNAILNIAPKGVIFRTSWVYNEEGKNFYLTMKKLLQPNAKLEVANDQIGIPNYAGTLASAAIEYIKVNSLDTIQIVNLVSSGQASWYDFAQLIQSKLGMSHYTDLIPVTTEHYNAKFGNKKIAIRPRYSVLSNELLASRYIIMPDWRHDFIKFMEAQYATSRESVGEI